MSYNSKPSFKKSYFCLVYLFLLSNFSLAIIYPIFTSLILKSSDFFPIEASYSHNFFLLSLLMSSFPFGLFLGWFCFRSLSKRFKLKSLFLISVALLTFSYLAEALFIKNRHYLLLLNARALSGLFTGNIFLCLTTLSAILSNQKIQKKLFSFLNALSMIAFIFAVLMGGLFSDAKISDSFHSYTPFYINASLYALAFLVTLVWLKKPKSLFYSSSINSCKKILAYNSFKILKDKSTAFYFSCFFFLILGWFSTIQFLATDILIRFQKDKVWVVMTLILAGICFTLGRSCSVKPFNKPALNNTTLKSSLVLTAGLQFGCNLTSHFHLFLGFFSLSIFFTSISWNLFSAIIFSTLKECDKPRGFYLIQLTIFIAIFLSPLIVCLIGQTDVKSIYLINSVSTITSFILFSLKK